MSNPKVCIIILNWNGKELLKRCLNSLFKLTNYQNYKVIIVDNGSTDGSVEYVKKNFPKADVLALNKNYGFAKGNNIGIKKSKGDFILLLNSDTKIIDSFFLNKMLKIAKEENVGIVGAQLLDENGRKQNSAAWIRPLKIFYYTGNKIKEVDWVSGACFLIKKELLEKIGLFDENFFLYYEETDYCYRAKKNNFKVVIQPAAKIIHYGGRTSRKMNQDFITYHWYKSRMYFFLKHRLIFHIIPRMIEDIFESFKNKKFHILIKSYKDAISLIL
jgi:hypothetical protein